ncbi:MAG: CBS domain-containing protein [Eubacterium sp.]
MLKDIMIPKVDITMVPLDITYNDLLKVIRKDKFTRMPVYKEDSDNVIGIINIKDMMLMGVNPNNFDITKIMREPYYHSRKRRIK